MLPSGRLPLSCVPACLVTAGAVFLGVGFVLHTDFDPDVLGKWCWGYALFLLGWWVLVVPLAFVVTRWAFTTQTLALPSGRTLRWRPSAKLLLLLALGLGFVLAARARIDRATGRGVATPLGSDVFHPFLQNVPKPGHAGLGTNAHGFRGSALAAPKPAGQTRVFLLGGSTLFAAPLPLAQTPGEVLEARLRAARPGLDVEVQNAAAEWHCSEHSLIKLLTQVLDLGPDIVVVCHAINDLYRSFSPPAFAEGPYRDDYGHFYGAVASLARPGEATWALVRMRVGYAFSDLLCQRVRVAGPRGDGVRGVTQMFFPKAQTVEVEDWPSLRAFERNLGDLVGIARSRGVLVLVGSQPSLYREDLTPREREVLWLALAHQQDGKQASLGSMAAGMRRFNATSRQVAERLGAPFVDLDAAVPRTTEYLYDDVHYTARGAARVGESLAEAILAAGGLDAR